MLMLYRLDLYIKIKDMISLNGVDVITLYNQMKRFSLWFYYIIALYFSV